MRLALYLTLLLLFASSSASAQTLTITHATVVDVSNGQLHPENTVVIERNRIVSVVVHGPTPPSGKVIDAHGRFLIPGLWDMHTHVFFDHTAADGK
ncbi:MAG TPA: hypothetical protein VK638_23700, partial [Edaphobacter sp.]|nr:hypothetical protein [Edaphobacter sp.]